MLHLLLGRSGFGKTHTVLARLEELARTAEPGLLVLLVPEQFSFESERALLERLGPRLTRAVKVWSFTRLADAVSRELGGRAGRRMDDATRTLLMSAALEQVSDRLTVYRRQAGDPEYVREMLSTLTEFRQCAVGPRQLEQAAAAVGQCELMYTYDKLFGEYNHTVAQILLTADDILDAQRRENFQNTLYRLLELDALPIINENDTVATKEIAVGDNDTLGAIVASCAKADLLVLFSDIHGLYTADPKEDPNATLIHRVEALTPEIRALAGTKGSELATGGMVTKIHAAEIATEAGVEMIICHGAYPESLYDIVAGKEVGTRFCVRKEGI